MALYSLLTLHHNHEVSHAVSSQLQHGAQLLLLAEPIRWVHVQVWDVLHYYVHLQLQLEEWCSAISCLALESLCRSQSSQAMLVKSFLAMLVTSFLALSVKVFVTKSKHFNVFCHFVGSLLLLPFPFFSATRTCACTF